MSVLCVGTEVHFINKVRNARTRKERKTYARLEYMVEHTAYRAESMDHF